MCNAKVVPHYETSVIVPILWPLILLQAEYVNIYCFQMLGVKPYWEWFDIQAIGPVLVKQDPAEAKILWEKESST